MRRALSVLLVVVAAGCARGGAPEGGVVPEAKLVDQDGRVTAVSESWPDAGGHARLEVSFERGRCDPVRVDVVRSGAASAWKRDAKLVLRDEARAVVAGAASRSSRGGEEKLTLPSADVDALSIFFGSRRPVVDVSSGQDGGVHELSKKAREVGAAFVNERRRCRS